MGQASASQVRAEFDRRTAQGEFRTVAHSPGAAGERYTTAAMLRMERETIQRMQEGNRAALGNAPLADARTRTETIERYPQLNPAQRTVADQIFESQEKIVGLDGVAGAGKTTTLAVIREGVEAIGYKVEGFAPTSRAAQQLSGAGIENSTLQAHLAKGAADRHRREKVLRSGRELAGIDQADRLCGPPSSERPRSPGRRHAPA